MASVRYTFTLDAVEDASLIRWLESQQNTSAAIREALRDFRARPTRAELERRLDEILDALRSGAITSAAPAAGQDAGQVEPAKAARGLDKMLGRFEGS